MSAPEIFWPPRNSVPLPGCANMDAILAIWRYPALEVNRWPTGEQKEGGGRFKSRDCRQASSDFEARPPQGKQLQELFTGGRDNPTPAPRRHLGALIGWCPAAPWQSVAAQPTMPLVSKAD